MSQLKRAAYAIVDESLRRHFGDLVNIKKSGTPGVHVDWILESVQDQVLHPVDNYPVDALENNESQPRRGMGSTKEKSALDLKALDDLDFTLPPQSPTGVIIHDHIGSVRRNKRTIKDKQFYIHAAVYLHIRDPEIHWADIGRWCYEQAGLDGYLPFCRVAVSTSNSHRHHITRRSPGSI